MKIVGLTYYEGDYRMVMKSDSSLLQGRQPFFLPDWSSLITVRTCVAWRVSHMGRHIEPRFAPRYCDGLALALNFRAEDKLQQGEWAEGMAFDQSFVLGGWLQPEQFDPGLLPTQPSMEEAVARISARMTLRTGDILFVDTGESQKVEREQKYTLYINIPAEDGTLHPVENLNCKIK